MLVDVKTLPLAEGVFVTSTPATDPFGEGAAAKAVVMLCDVPEIMTVAE